MRRQSGTPASLPVMDEAADANPHVYPSRSPKQTIPGQASSEMTSWCAVSEGFRDYGADCLFLWLPLHIWSNLNRDNRRRRRLSIRFIGHDAISSNDGHHDRFGAADQYIALHISICPGRACDVSGRKRQSRPLSLRNGAHSMI